MATPNNLACWNILSYWVITGLPSTSACSAMAAGNMEASRRLTRGDGGKTQLDLRRKLKNSRSAPGVVLATFKALVSRLMGCCDYWDEQGTNIGKSQVMNVDVYFSIPVLPAASTL